MQDPFHQYNTPGYFTVTLIINGGGAGNTSTKIAYIHVGTVGIAENKKESGEVSVYPNPFTTAATINFNLKKDEAVKVEISDVAGKIVRTLQNSKMMKGVKTLVWDGKSDGGEKLSAGSYIINIKGETFNTNKKIILERK